MNCPGMRTLLKTVIVVSFLAASLGGCKQGEGDVCQIGDDCEDGLECNAGTRRCQRPGTVTPPDASTVDANTADAAGPDAGE